MKLKITIGIILIAAASLVAEDTYSTILATDMRLLLLKRYEGAKSCDDRNWPADDSSCKSLASAVGILMLRSAKNVDSPPKGAASND
jgi:hypothetical protein